MELLSGVTAYGFYVELPNTVEGLVHITALSDDYYEFDEKTMNFAETLRRKFTIWDRKLRSEWQMQMH